MKIYITGASNFIAQSLANQFRELGYEILGSSRSTSPIKGITLLRQDQVELTNPQLSSGMFNSVDILVHLAWDYKNSEACVAGTKAIFERAKADGVKKQLLISSYSAREDSISSYGQSKYALEQYFLQNNQYICRPGLVLGDGGLFEKIKKIVALSPIIPIIDKNQNRTPLIDVDTLSLAIFKLLQSPAANIGNFFFKDSVLIYDLVRSILKISYKKRVLLNTPLFLPSLVVSVIEFLKVPFPITSDNIRGLKQNQQRVHESNLDKFIDIRGSSLETILKEITYKTSKRREAKYLYHALFDKRPSNEFFKRFEQAHLVMFQSSSQEEMLTIKKIIYHNLDAEAIELAFRQLKSHENRHLLTKKLHAISYLAEFESRHYGDFVNEQSSLLKGYLLGVLMVLRAITKTIRGRRLIKRYNLV